MFSSFQAVQDTFTMNRELFKRKSLRHVTFPATQNVSPYDITDFVWANFTWNRLPRSFLPSTFDNEKNGKKNLPEKAHI